MAPEDFRLLFNACPLPCLVLQPDLTIVEANAAYSKVTGRSHQEILAGNFATTPLVKDSLQRVISQLQPDVLTISEGIFPGELTAAPGHSRAWRVSHIPIIDVSGLRFILQQVENISELQPSQDDDELRRTNETLEQRVEQRTTELLATQALIRTVYDYSSECHAIMRALGNGQFMYEEVNPALLQLYGKNRDQVVGRTVDELLGAQLAREINAHLLNSLNSDEPYRYSRSQGGRTVEAVSVRVPGDAQCVVVSARDITDNHILEERLRQALKMEAVGQLTGGIAHDFNNLLTVVIGNLDRLEHELTDERALRSATLAMLGARKAAELTHRLLAFSRKQPLAPKPVELNALIKGMSEMLRRVLGETIVVENNGDDQPCMILADPNQMENALLNLALNARDAMLHGGMLSIRASHIVLDESYVNGHVGAQPGEYIRVSISDTGAGMSSAVVEKAFEPFFTTKEVGQGTGLGLSMVYGFIKQSHGYVDIDSELGRGTTVNIYLPRLQGEHAVEVSPSGESDESVTQKNLTILAVEDNDQVREYTITVLGELGYRVLQAADARQALTIIESESIDVLFSDIVLPGGMNGYQLAQVACRQHPELKVLLTSGYPRDIVGDDVDHLDVLHKPFTMMQLATRLRRVIEANRVCSPTPHNAN